MSGEARFAGILRQAVSLFRWGSAVIAESFGKDVTKVKYPRLKLRRRSPFDTLNMKKWFLILGAVFALGTLTPQPSKAGFFIGFPIPVPVFYGPHYYVGPAYYYPPGYYWGPYGYAYYRRPYWRHRYWAYHHWRYY
jgi:hypothetical protein